MIRAIAAAIKSPRLIILTFHPLPFNLEDEIHRLVFPFGALRYERFIKLFEAFGCLR